VIEMTMRKLPQFDRPCHAKQPEASGRANQQSEAEHEAAN
jgi:hypothetical protein